ncbi:MAG: hypothetical protein ACRD0Y_14420 [Terriglobales bacterium]
MKTNSGLHRINIFVWAAVVLPLTVLPLACQQSTVPLPSPPPQAQGTQSKKKQKKAATAGSPKHIFFVIPAYNVDYQRKFVPLTQHEKFIEWTEGAYDPIGRAADAVEAGLEHSKDGGFCGYGSGLDNYGKCYGSALLDANISSFLGDYLFVSWLHQDPRYFRLGTEASFPARVWYSLSRVFVARTDRGGWTFASGATAGSVLTAAASNLYYPRDERNLSHTVSRLYWDFGSTAIFNLEAEFWPDIKHGVGKIF